MNHQKIVVEIQLLIRGWTGNRDEQRILELLASCTGTSLDDVLREVGAHRLVRNIHNRRRGADNRTALLQLLVGDRLQDLSLQTRTDIIWALQKGFTHQAHELVIRDIFLASSGEELRQLRNVVNRSGTYQDLSRLIFSDIDDGAIRTQILDHIAANKVPTNEVKVLSDIDDTVFARLHDRRYPGKTRYPGVLAFFISLDRAPDGGGEPGDLTFVTARPSLIAGFVSWFTRRSLRKAGVRDFTILTGSLLALLSHSRMAERKLRNIRRYHRLFPEYDIVFVGDSGQGDVLVGRQILEEMGEDVRGVFINDVKAANLSESQLHTDEGITYFDTYITAATEVWRAGIISAEQALSVGETAIKDLKAVVAITPQVRQERLAEHIEDLDALKMLIKSHHTNTP